MTAMRTGMARTFFRQMDSTSTRSLGVRPVRATEVVFGTTTRRAGTNALERGAELTIHPPDALDEVGR